MTLREQLLFISKSFLDAPRDGRPPKGKGGLSRILFKDGKTIDRVASGGDISTANFERCMAWFSANWPASAPWPVEVPRPAGQNAEAA